LNPDLPHDGIGNFGLKLEHVREVVIEILGPEMSVGRSVNQLRRDTHSPTNATHRALDDGIDAKLTADLRQVLRRLLVLHDRGARDHLERAHLGKARNQLLVMPSEKYSSPASPERLSNGSTAIDRMVGEATAPSRPVARHQNPAMASSAMTATPAESRPRRGRGAAFTAVVDATPVFRPTRRRSTTKSRID
jgi:hypothetical protein